MKALDVASSFPRVWAQATCTVGTKCPASGIETQHTFSFRTFGNGRNPSMNPMGFQPVDGILKYPKEFHSWNSKVHHLRTISTLFSGFCMMTKLKSIWKVSQFLFCTSRRTKSQSTTKSDLTQPDLCHPYPCFAWGVSLYMFLPDAVLECTCPTLPYPHNTALLGFEKHNQRVQKLWSKFPISTLNLIKFIS